MTKTPEELTEEWKAGELASGLYYVGNDKVKDFAFVKSNEISVYTLDSKIPMLLKDNAEILAPIPTYDEYKAMQVELAELKEKVADQKTDLESARWYQTVQNEDIGKLRGLLKECKNIVAHDCWREAQFPDGQVVQKQDLLTRINAAIDESGEK